MGYTLALFPGSELSLQWFSATYNRADHLEASPLRFDPASISSFLEAGAVLKPSAHSWGLYIRSGLARRVRKTLPESSGSLLFGRYVLNRSPGCVGSASPGWDKKALLCCCRRATLRALIAEAASSSRTLL